MLWPSWINRARGVCGRSGNDNSHYFIKPSFPPQLQTNSPPLKKEHLHRRGQVDLKNMIPTLHRKHKKKCFLPSMGSTFSIFATPPQPNNHFFLGKITAEGCQKWQIVIPTLHEKQKQICFLRSMGSWFFTFVTYLDWYWHFWLDSPGSGRFASRFETFLTQFRPHHSRQGSRLREFTSQTPSNYPSLNHLSTTVSHLLTTY